MSDSEHEDQTQSPGEPVDISTAIRRKVVCNDSRYHLNAYRFIYEALEFTQAALGRDPASEDPVGRHVTGRELLEGVRGYAAQEFGPLAAVVFRSWGVERTEDFGEIVFNLVEAELMGKTDTDTRADFADGYDFDKAFDGPVKIK